MLCYDTICDKIRYNLVCSTCFYIVFDGIVYIKCDLIQVVVSKLNSHIEFLLLWYHVQLIYLKFRIFRETSAKTSRSTRMLTFLIFTPPQKTSFLLEMNSCDHNPLNKSEFPHVSFHAVWSQGLSDPCRWLAKAWMQYLKNNTLTTNRQITTARLWNFLPSSSLCPVGKFVNHFSQCFLLWVKIFFLYSDFCHAASLDLTS